MPLAGKLPAGCWAARGSESGWPAGWYRADGQSNRGPIHQSGTKNYKWQVIRTRAATATGDQRINPFGIGGEIEIRSDLLTQKQIITSPLLHFGLGDHAGVEFARIVWPNGLIQAEFDAANRTNPYWRSNA